MNRSAIAKVTAVGVFAVLILAGAVGVYFYTLAPTGPINTTSSLQTSRKGTAK
jgi:hypothetical protein